MNWNHGYYADSGYTYGFYPETMPSRLHWAALIQDHEVPMNHFRYLDAGCGQGYNLIAAAIAHPDSEFVGIDFMPEHIAHARGLAERCGLTNIQFIEGDFIELAKNPSGLGNFDYAVCHGISTWVAPSVKSALFDLIGKILRPGGIFYNSYNTFPGWLGMVPFQHLVLLDLRTKDGKTALKSAINTLKVLKEHSPKMAQALPAFQSRMNTFDKQDPAYLLQEYNNVYWQPVFVTQMMDELAAVKLSYMGTATLSEAFAEVLPVSVQELIKQEHALAIKEQLRDYATNQNFRRDLYVKGAKRPWTLAKNEKVKAARFIINSRMKRPEEGQPFAIKGGSIELNVDAEFYGGLLDFLSDKANGATVGEMIDHQVDQHLKNSVLLAVSLLLHAGYLFIWQTPESGTLKDQQRQATLAVAEAACEGAPYNHAPLPAIGGAYTLTDIEWVMLREFLNGTDVQKWPALIMANLQLLGRALAKEGQPVTEISEIKKILNSAIEKFFTSKAFHWKGLL